MMNAALNKLYLASLAPENSLWTIQYILPGAKPSGKFASTPIKKLATAEEAAVAVVRSLRTIC